MLALIDADVIVHAELAAEQGRDHFGDGTVDVTRAYDGAQETIAEWCDAAGCDEHILVFSPSDRSNFRNGLGIGYKDNRTSEKTQEYWLLEARLKGHHPWYSIDYLEGDDVIGIMHTSKDVQQDTVSISIDKDMKTIPGLLYNPSKMSAPVMITRNQATWFWMLQTLMGDAVDGYKGCPGIGEVKAKKALPLPTSESDPDRFLWRCWDTVVAKYLEAYSKMDMEPQDIIPEAHDAAVAQARAARILHAEDYRKGEIRLWHPDSPEWVDPARTPKVT